VDCEVCKQSVQLKVFDSHMRLHTLEKQNRPLPFTLCRNALCSRPAETTNRFQLCRFWCVLDNARFLISNYSFSPLYVQDIDPSGVKLRQRLVFKYASQLLQGCKNRKCMNVVNEPPVCYFGPLNSVFLLQTCCRVANTTLAKLAGKDVNKLADDLAAASLLDLPGQFFLCVEESTGNRRAQADQVSFLFIYLFYFNYYFMMYSWLSWAIMLYGVSRPLRKWKSSIARMTALTRTTTTSKTRKGLLKIFSVKPQNGSSKM